jgi:ribosomal protein L7/L12
MKYHVVTGFNLEALVANVGLFLQKGWTPLGGVTAAPGVSPFSFLQAVVAESDHAEIPVIGPAWELEAKALCATGKKINAIKIVRENTGIGLKEAKDLVESWHL